MFAGAVPFLKLMGIVAGGWQMARAALVAEKKLAAGRRRGVPARPRSPPRASTPTTCWSQAPGLRDTVVKGAAGVMALSDEQFLAA